MSVFDWIDGLPAGVLLPVMLLTCAVILATLRLLDRGN